MNKSTIFLVEEDNAMRPRFKRLLLENGYEVMLAVDENDAFQRVSDGLVESDLILVNLVGKTETEILAFGKRLREAANLNIPVIAIAEKYKEELAGTTIQAGDNEYIIYLGSGDELFDLLSRLRKSKSSD